MAEFLARRLGYFAIATIVASLVIFWMLRLVGGDITYIILGDGATEAARAELQQRLGLDRPLWTQYTEWFRGLLSGDLGHSLRTGTPVSQMIATRARITIPLALLGLLLALLVAIPAGTVAAAKHAQGLGAGITILSQIGVAIPVFWAGVLLTSVFAVRLGWLPAGGFVGWDVSVWGSLRSLALPVLSLGLVLGAILTRYVRAAVLDVMTADYVRTARAYGLTKNAALVRHGLKNASVPIVTVIGLHAGELIGGAVVVETVFALPGIGRMLLTAVWGRDVILVQSSVMILVVMVLIINLIVDLTYGFLDPRIRIASKS